MIRPWVVLGAVLLTSSAIPAAASAAELCSNGNGFAVLNRPASSATPCRFARPVRIRTIMTYHWNNSRGAAGGTISLRHIASGKLYGPFAVNATSGQAGAPNVYWTAQVDLSLPAGDYEIRDSDIATWSWNTQSGGNGIVVVTGDVLASLPAESGTAIVRSSAPSAPTAAPPRGMHRMRTPLRRPFR